MRYGGDKIKVVDKNLTLGDYLQVLGFDTCGFLLLGKWDDSYGTKGDPLRSTTEACYDPGDCPMCQPRVKDIMDLPGWPEKCSGSTHTILALNKSGELIGLCESAIKCEDRKVATSNGDEEPGYLKDKIVACDTNGPIILRELTDGGYHKMCIGFDKEKTKMNFEDLENTPKELKKGLLVSDGTDIDFLEPEICTETDYSYVVYNKKRDAFITMCPQEESFADWTFDGGTCIVPINDGLVRIYATNKGNAGSGDKCFSGSGHLKATNDILTGTEKTIFSLTKPGVYVISCNSTCHIQSHAGINAIRGGLCFTYGDAVEEWTDFKYDARDYSPYINDDYPNPQVRDGGERVLPLSIFSFNTTHSLCLPNVSPNNPLGIGFWVRYDTNINDERYKTAKQKIESVTISLTGGEFTLGPKTKITCFRKGDVPQTYRTRF